MVGKRWRGGYWRTWQYWEPLADAEFSEFISQTQHFKGKILVVGVFFFPLEDPTTQGSGFSTVNLVSKFFFPSVLTD